MISLMAERPPYVQFERRAVVDTTATQEAGHPVYTDMDVALVTPAGSKDMIEKIVSEWLPDVERKAAKGEYNPQWANHFRALYEAWCKQEAAPEFGNSIKMWPGATPAQIRSILAANIRTVEDLAAANEQALAYIGMGGRALKDRAAAWLAEATTKGIVTQENATLKRDLEQAKADLDALRADNADMRKMIESLSEPKQVRRRFEQAVTP